MFVYALTFPNGKKYIGQTVRTITVRISQHARMVRYGSKLPVHCAWRKHGEPAIEVLGEYSEMAQLHDAERQFIAEFGTLSPNGYNVGYGGDTAPSKSPEVAAKIAAKKRGQTHRTDAKAKISEGLRERWADPEYRARVLEGVARSMTPERRAEIGQRARELLTGKPKSEAHKEKLRNRVISEETRRKMSEAAKRRKREPRSPETRRKMAESAARTWQDREIRQRRSLAIRAALSK